MQNIRDMVQNILAIFHMIKNTFLYGQAILFLISTQDK